MRVHATRKTSRNAANRQLILRGVAFLRARFRRANGERKQRRAFRGDAFHRETRRSSSDRRRMAKCVAVYWKQYHGSGNNPLHDSERRTLADRLYPANRREFAPCGLSLCVCDKGTPALSLLRLRGSPIAVGLLEVSNEFRKRRERRSHCARLSLGKCLVERAVGAERFARAKSGFAER